MSNDFLGYSGNESDDDVKIYKTKDSYVRPAAKPARVEAVDREYTEKSEELESRERPVQKRSARKREIKKYRELTAKDIAVPVFAAAVFAVVWFLPTADWVRAVSFLIPYMIAGFDVILKALEGITERRPLSEALVSTLFFHYCLCHWTVYDGSTYHAFVQTVLYGGILCCETRQETGI